MENVRDKMYNYEVTPPAQSWQIIAATMGEVNSNDIILQQRSNKMFYISLAAAAVTILFITVVIHFTDSEKNREQIIGGQLTKSFRSSPVNKITVPLMNEDSIGTEIQAGTTPETPTKKYITISGPQGQPVKISSKVVSLIVSSDHQDPPNPVWNEKVKKWKNIMKDNILGPSTAGFLDIVDLTHALNEQQ